MGTWLCQDLMTNWDDLGHPTWFRMTAGLLRCQGDDGREDGCGYVKTDLCKQPQTLQNMSGESDFPNTG